VLGLSALCALALACERPVPRAEISERVATLERPNIVLILIDMLRADRTTPYGFELDTSPQLRRWADRGVLFERVLAQSSWTKMSVASLMASFGIQTNGWLHASFGFQQGFDRYVFPFGKGAKLPHSQIWPHVDRVVDEAARLIDARDPDTPFFLYLHFMDVHEYAAPPEFRSFGTDTEANYHAAIRWVDDGLERVYAKLDDAGVLGDTLIVLGSDHGETFGENGKHGHARNVLSAVLHVPLVIRFPFPIEPVRIPVQVRNLDVAPTLLDIAGVPIPESFEGRSLLPLVTGAGDGDLTSFAGLGLPLYRDASVQISVTDGSWTFARNVEPDPNRDEFLYDRSVDPGENANLLGREPAQEQRMRKLLDDHVSEEPSAEVMESDVRIDPGIAQRLRAMGYLQ
jgi:arylsulfatase A-like enzyme